MTLPAERIAPPASRADRRDMKQLCFYGVTAAIAVTLACATLELGSYLYFLHRLLGDEDLRIFLPSASPMAIAVKPNFSQAWNYAEFHVTVRTNGSGLREDFELPAGKRIDVGFLGDSFTFGQGVNAGERYSDVVRDCLGDRLVVSYSYPNGWAPPLYYLFLREHPELIPRVAVVGLFLGNDLSSDMFELQLVTGPDGELLRAAPIFREVDEVGRLVNRETNRVNRVLRRFWSGRLLLHLNTRLGLGLRWLQRAPVSYPAGWQHPDLDGGKLDRQATVALQYVLKIRDLVEARQGRLVVLFIPWSFYVSDRYRSPYPPEASDRIRRALPLLRTLHAWCHDYDVTCVDPIQALRRAEQAGEPTYFAVDGHWTAAGHRVAGMALIDTIRRALADQAS